MLTIKWLSMVYFSSAISALCISFSIICFLQRPCLSLLSLLGIYNETRWFMVSDIVIWFWFIYFSRGFIYTIPLEFDPFPISSTLWRHTIKHINVSAFLMMKEIHLDSSRYLHSSDLFISSMNIPIFIILFIMRSLMSISGFFL